MNPDEFTIIVKAIRNGKKEGYAAIDDIKLIPYEECKTFPEEAEPQAPTTTVEPPINNCDFQNDLCQWTHRAGEFQFNRTTGKALVDLGLNGPPKDHTDDENSK